MKVRHPLLIGFLLLAVVAIGLLVWIGSSAIPLYRYGQRSYSIREKIWALNERRPATVDPQLWEESVGWVVTAHCNVCFSEEHASYEAMCRFEEQLDKKLEGDADLGTIEWIGDRLAETGPHGQRYMANWREHWKARVATASEWRLIGRLELPHGFLRHIAFSSDGNHLAATTGWSDPGGHSHAPIQGTVILIDTGKPEVASVFKSQHFGAPDAVAFTEDNTSVVALWDDGAVMYWNRKGGKLEKTLDGPDEARRAVYVLAGAKIAAWLCDDGRTRIWSLPSQEERAVVQTGVFLKLAISPDIKRIAVARQVLGTGIPAGNEPGMAVIWNVDRKIAEASLMGHDEAVCSVAFSPDGKVVATGGNDGVVRWN